jgi:hypothetical protein
MDCLEQHIHVWKVNFAQRLVRESVLLMKTLRAYATNEGNFGEGWNVLMYQQGGMQLS